MRLTITFFILAIVCAVFAFGHPDVFVNGGVVFMKICFFIFLCLFVLGVLFEYDLFRK